MDTSSQLFFCFFLVCILLFFLFKTKPLKQLNNIPPPQLSQPSQQIYDSPLEYYQYCGIKHGLCLHNIMNHLL